MTIHNSTIFVNMNLIHMRIFVMVTFLKCSFQNSLFFKHEINLE